MDKLIQVIIALREFSDHKDIEYLLEFTREIQPERGYEGRMHGVEGGMEAFGKDPRFRKIQRQLRKLTASEQRVIEEALITMFQHLSPLPTQARGKVHITTIYRKYAVIDWASTNDTDGIVYARDSDGNVLTETFSYRYAYVRLLGVRGDKSRRRTKHITIYADRGMGRQGSGGYVAAALDNGLITDDDVLDAWHHNRQSNEPLTKTSANYEKFIELCRSMRVTSGASASTLSQTQSAAE